MRLTRQFFSFAAIGVLNTAVQFALFTLLFRWLGVSMLIASASGYAAGVANSYWMNRNWTFAAAAPSSAAEFLRFALVNVVSLSLNLLTLKWLTASRGWIPELAQLGAIAVAVVANFSGNRFWTFRIRQQAEPFR